MAYKFTSTVRWALSTESIDRARQIAKHKDVRVTSLVNYAIDKIFEQYFDVDEPAIAPWDVLGEKAALLKEYGHRYEGYVGKNGKKASLAWAIANDKAFLASLNDGFNFTITTKWLRREIEMRQVMQPESFYYKFTPTTLVQLAAILMVRGNITRIKRGEYAVTIDWKPAEETPDTHDGNDTDPYNLGLVPNPDYEPDPNVDYSKQQGW